MTILYTQPSHYMSHVGVESSYMLPIRAAAGC